MRFITEEDLRLLHRKEALTTFNLTKDVRLTPGARQFLSDKRIKVVTEDSPAGSATSSAPKHSDNTAGEQAADSNAIDWKKQRLSSELKSIANTFLLVACELQGRDIALSQRVVAVGQDIAAMHESLGENTPLQDLEFEECYGITKENFSSPLDDCFEITAEHMHLPNGKEILLLNKLRCAMHKLEVSVMDFCGTSHDENNFGVRVNQIRNVLSQMICTALGGNECQRNA
ncbi:hypothetical protein [Halodesulfovibrio sp.]|jgi:hypothetical protein|uniref:hypothetical protein n=1 Tax=Halodesulfovibrio sp. TaxID=1912772 RepID=UPI0025FFC05D|nr:hypothetical protein [Halodesulfovibrio sp.]MCT4535119.1 hypothetical protein [Halodesulfovibrio sp.]MCT4627417.1 hypothetical protein [Halodesulfovibrio sp.]